MSFRSALCATLSTKVFHGCSSVPNVSCSPVDDVREWPYQAAHFGNQDLLAFSSFTPSGDVFVVDMNSMQLVQTLHGHPARVTCVRWQAPPSSYLQHGLHLFSGDESGTVVLWDVSEGVIVNTIKLPRNLAVRLLSLMSQDQLLVVADDCSSYLYDANLTSVTPLRDASPPLTQPKEEGKPFLFRPMNMTTSPLSLQNTLAFVLGDRIRVVGSMLDGAKDRRKKSWGKDLIYDSADGAETVLDATFSESNEEVLYFATRSSISCYDWKLALMLSDQVVWHSGGVEFRRIFPSSPVSFAEHGSSSLPLVYSFNTDQRLSAWYVLSTEKFVNVSVDVRGARMPAKIVASVVQSAMESSVFAVVFVDGSVARWRLRTKTRQWCLEGYLNGVLVKPTTMCTMANGDICCALDTGHLALLSAVNGAPLRRYNIVYAGGTKVVAVTPCKRDESVWIVTSRSAPQQLPGSEFHHQISEFDTHTGEVLRVLREPPPTGEVAPLRGVTADLTGTFLLVLLGNGHFEVWNTDNGNLLHINSDSSVTYACWAPQRFIACMAGTPGDAQLLSIMTVEGNAGFLSVHRDRVTRQRSIVPLFSANNTCVSQAIAAGEFMVCVDGVGTSSVVHEDSGALCISRLRQMPLRVPVIHVSTSAAAKHFSRTTGAVDAPSSPMGGAGDTGDELSTPYVALVFENNWFGVWNARTQERVGFSATNRVHLFAVCTAWIGSSLAVLTLNGSIAIVDRSVTYVNSNVSSKCLRRPIQSSAFLLPAHRTYVQSAFEVAAANRVAAGLHTPGGMLADASEGSDNGEPSRCAAELPRTVFSSSWGPSSLASETMGWRRSSRVALGAVVPNDAATLQDELRTYMKTCIPAPIYQRIQQATACGKIERVAYWVARLNGNREKQRFWAQVCQSMGSWGKDGGEEVDGGAHALPVKSEPESTLAASPRPFFAADPYGECVAPVAQLRHNRTWLSAMRMSAIQSIRCQNIDDGSIRLAVARDLIKLHELTAAAEVLIEANFDTDQFNSLATLAVAVAASTQIQTRTPLFDQVTKWAAAMLLAKGDVEGAIEKFALAGDHYEVSLTLQSKGRWGEAAVAAKLSPTTPVREREILYRWARHCAQRGDCMPAARMLLSFSSPSTALVLLSESPHYADVAGLLGLLLLQNHAPLLRTTLDDCIESPSKVDDADGDSAPCTLRGVLASILGDYASILASVGNRDAEKFVRSTGSVVQTGEA